MADEDEGAFDPEIWRRAVEIQIDSLKEGLEDLEAKVDRRFVESQGKIATIDQNTTEVVEILRDWKGAMRVLKFTAKVIAPLSVIATAITAASALLGLLK